MTNLEVFAIISALVTLLTVEFLIRASGGYRHAERTMPLQRDHEG